VQTRRNCIGKKTNLGDRKTRGEEKDLFRSGQGRRKELPGYDTSGCKRESGNKASILILVKRGSGPRYSCFMAAKDPNEATSD